jgi:glycosyltransferase involved in cell wall biosynthesis
MIPIRFVGDPFSISGYSEHIRELMMALLDKKANLSLLYTKQAPIDLPGPHMDRLKPLMGHDNGAKLDVYVTIPPVMQYSNEAVAGITTFETDGLPRGWAMLLNNLKLVMVPSWFNVGTFVNAGVTAPIEKVREGFDPFIYKPDATPWKINIPADVYKFLSILEWNPRKAWDRLLAAYWNEFDGNDNVALVLKVSGPTNNPNYVNHIRSSIESVKKMMGLSGVENPYKMSAPVYVIYNNLLPGEVAGLHVSCDAFVSASHGEGFNRGALHSAACGKPVVAVGWGGHLDFLNHDNAYLADYSISPCISPVGAAGNYTPEMKWAEVDLISMGAKMRECKNDGKDARVAKVGEEFTWDRAAQEFIDVIGKYYA